MISKKSIKTLSSLLKIKEADIEAAIAAESETDLAIPEDIKTFTPIELETRDQSIKGTSYNEGKEAGGELLIKDLKKELGLNFEGKDKAAFVTEVKKMQANPEGVDVETLRNNIRTAEQKASEAESALQAFKLRSKVASFLPKNLALEMSSDEQLTLLEANGFKFTEDENGNVRVSRNGQELKDEKLQTPIAADAAVSGFFKDKGWLKEVEEEEKKQGRGGGSSKTTPATYTKMSQLVKEYEQAGKGTNTAEFATHAQKVAKENPDFDFDS